MSKNDELTDTLRDQTEVYNLPKFDGFHSRHLDNQPQVLQNHIEEIERFSRKCHDLVVVKLVKLFAIMLELPNEDQLVHQHQYDVKGEDHLRYMHYAPYSPEDNERIGSLYSAGHTDLGSVTLLFRQPVAALQILNSDNQCRWVKPLNQSITANICDALSAMTRKFLKSSAHRLHTPPSDQAHLNRLGVLCFARPNNHVVLDPIYNSPVMKSLGLETNEFTDIGNNFTMEEWCKVRRSQQQRRTDKPKIEGTKYEYSQRDMEIVPGLQARVYN